MKLRILRRCLNKACVRGQLLVVTVAGTHVSVKWQGCRVLLSRAGWAAEQHDFFSHFERAQRCSWLATRAILMYCVSACVHSLCAFACCVCFMCNLVAYARLPKHDYLAILQHFVRCLKSSKGAGSVPVYAEQMLSIEYLTLILSSI